MPEEKIIEFLQKILELNQLLIPILFLLIGLFFMCGMRFLSFMIEEHDKNEEAKYKRLKEKFKDDDK